MMWTYFYEVKYWVEEYLRIDTERGFIRAANYKDATSQLSSWYGEDQLEFISLYAIEDGDGPLTIGKIMKTLDERVKNVE